MPTAPITATASLPNRPTHAISVKLYAICMNDVAMIGMASLNNCLFIAPFVRSFTPCTEKCSDYFAAKVGIKNKGGKPTL
jgi:hypothetical protein